jgi:hypothetical protein
MEDRERKDEGMRWGIFGERMKKEIEKDDNMSGGIRN